MTFADGLCPETVCRSVRIVLPWRPSRPFPGLFIRDSARRPWAPSGAPIVVILMMLTIRSGPQRGWGRHNAARPR